MQRVHGIVGGHTNAVILVSHQTVGVPGSMSDPDPFALTHQGVERHRHTAECRDRDYGSVLSGLVEIGLPVGNNDEHR
jgi:hypothetical protein